MPALPPALALFAALHLAAAGTGAAPGAPGTLPAILTPAAGTTSQLTRAGLEEALLAAAPTLRPEPLQAALAAFEDLAARGAVRREVLSVIDYSLPSATRRLWVFDLASRRLLFHEWVAHGRNTGEDLAIAFSNEDGSLMTSLGAFVTGATYLGRNGYSLRLIGLDRGRNDHAEARAIVMHGAPYVSNDFVVRAGRLGRSHGCPAVRPEIARELLDRVKGGSLLYAWHPLLRPPS